MRPHQIATDSITSSMYWYGIIVLLLSFWPFLTVDSDSLLLRKKKTHSHQHAANTLNSSPTALSSNLKKMSKWGKVKAKVTAISDATYWQELKTEDGEVYYYNSHTDETAWERPAAMDLQHASVEETKSHGGEVHGIAGDLKPLQKFRNKKEYDNRNNDHLKFQTVLAALIGHEKVKFSDFCYRIIPAQNKEPLSIEPARLMITSSAVYDFDIGQAPGQRLKPQRRLPLLASASLLLFSSTFISLLKFCSTHLLTFFSFSCSLQNNSQTNRYS